MEFSHYSVLLQETIEQLHIKPDGVYLDGTLGGGGHAWQVCSRLNRNGRFYGIDQDDAAIAAATARLQEFQDRVTIMRTNFYNAKSALAEKGVTHVDGIVLDLGVSSYQLDHAERGFSYNQNARLDMRMDLRQSLTAEEIVNEYPEMELFRIIRDYGEDRFAKNIAKHIVQARNKRAIQTTEELSVIIKAAIRIECNKELEVLKDSLEDMISLLNPSGRLCIITFHSLEDRIVKSAFRAAENPCICPPDFPVCMCGRKPEGKVITKKPILPGDKELEENTRSKSAKLRVFEKISHLIE